MIRGNGNGSCQDCGNKAKRDCEHNRCRTCCKSRGLHCPTHVRSTWIPLARRRHLLQQRLPLSSASSRPLRLLTSSSGLQGRNTNPNLPGEVTAVANFRCVRVSSDDNAVDQAAYQTSVSIGGHFFKGILYDQGPSSLTETSSADNHNQCLYHHHHQLVGATFHPGGGAGGSTSGNSDGMQFPPPPPLYAPPFNPSFLPSAGMQFFPHPIPMVSTTSYASF